MTKQIDSFKMSAEEKFNLLVEFGKRISTELQLDSLLDIVAHQITDILSAGRCTIFLKINDKELWSKIAQGKGLEHTEIRIPLAGNNIVAHVARTGETINISNAYDDPRFSMDIDMVTDFRTKSLLVIPLKNHSGQVIGVCQVANKFCDANFTKEDEGILYLITGFASRALEIAMLYQEVHMAQLETIYRLAITAEYRDQQDTRMHLKNISIIAYLLALALGLNKQEADLIRNASPLHDIGKVALADSILLKPGKLTPEEFETMKAHTIYGGRILEGARSKVLKMAYKMSLCHHEKWNGKGYPKGLKQKEIPLGARIVSVADVFDALCALRVYKRAWKQEEAYAYILKESGESFDPICVEAFKKIYPTVAKLYEEKSTQKEQDVDLEKTQTEIENTFSRVVESSNSNTEIGE